MLRTRLSKAIVAVVVIGLVGLTLTFGNFGGGSTASADDSTHTTSWAPVSETWDPSVGTENLMKATFTTTDASDATWRIDTYRRPPGGTEYLCSGGEGSSADGNTTITVALSRAGLPSGTVLRARFRSWDSSDDPRFHFSRTYTVP